MNITVQLKKPQLLITRKLLIIVEEKKHQNKWNITKLQQWSCSWAMRDFNPLSPVAIYHEQWVQLTFISLITSFVGSLQLLILLIQFCPTPTCVQHCILSTFRVSVEKTLQATRAGFEPTTSCLLVQMSNSLFILLIISVVFSRVYKTYKLV